MSDANSTTQIVEKLLETVHRLRAPNGCPWDRAQTHQSLRPYLIEEAYEVLEVLDQVESETSLKDAKICAHFKEELGDLLMQVLLHSEMAGESGAFHFKDVAEELNTKLVRRHPHVFGDIKVDSAEAAFGTWEKEKAKEKKKKNASASVLDGVPSGLPALRKAARYLEKVTKVGFQWSDLEGPMQKVDEEWDELKRAIAEESPKDIESELGDLLFTICNLAHLKKINPEDALRTTLDRFNSRFRFVEKRLAERGKSPEASTLAEMDRFWDEAKNREK